ncbi:MAG: aminotransferase class I/II-fold pyridoxal phosphate-dependent enzyme [Erysipelotrichaceae bacterium]|nr:aminotransferase class I/II-fold pyridoxal phosphate-dependent enzyme [Erysipelotrichaceae bacterium]
MKDFHLSIFSELLDEKRDYESRTGLNVLDFSLGSPDIAPSPLIIDVMEKAVRDPKNYRYAVTMLPAMRSAIQQWYQNRYDVQLEDDEIVLLQGSQEALVNLPLIYCNPGDGILVPNPYYPVYVDAPRLAQADILFMPLKAENDFLIDLDAISEEDCRKAKMMIVCYPNNPTGATAPDWFVEKLIAFAKKNNILVVYDNAYSDLNFKNPRSRSFLSYPGARDTGVEINSFSKSYGMAGARLGVLLGNREVIAAYEDLKSNMDYGVFLPVQYAGMEALQTGSALLKETRDTYKHRQDLLIDLFGQAGWKLTPSEGTMFLWAPVPKNYSSASEFARDLLRKTGVMVTPGNAFGSAGDGFVRIALVQPDAVIKEAAGRIQKAEFFRKQTL